MRLQILSDHRYHRARNANLLFMGFLTDVGKREIQYLNIEMSRPYLPNACSDLDSKYDQ